jgi:hypothetical protein
VKDIITVLLYYSGQFTTDLGTVITLSGLSETV